MQSNRAYEKGREAAKQDLGLHPVTPPAPWTRGTSKPLPVRTGSALEKRAFRGNDRLHGGPADKASPSDFNPKELRKGQRHEMEHTDDPQLAKEIASDHLTEHPRYYTQLIRSELK